jgi:hypothetical protein
VPKISSKPSINLPAVVDSSTSVLAQITSALGVPREIIASDGEIANAWSQLPRLLEIIPPALRSEHHARMCIAVAAGLFDAAINYVWNSAIIELRDKIRRFGLHVVTQLIGKDFDDETLSELKDAELLEFCLKLNLVSEDAFFFLDHCRDTRNNFSSAHPPMGTIDDDEFIVFLKRCAKYALSDTSNPTGVDTQALIRGVKRARFLPEQTTEWSQRIANTHDAQRGLIFSTLHGIYCDPKSTEESRLNSFDLCKECCDYLSPSVRSELLNRHSDYVANGESDRQTASQLFFEQMGLLSYLGTVEQHTIVSVACARLMSVHQAFYNFYNEPPFAERLQELSNQVAVPASCQNEFVTVVVTCAVGNEYGICRAALPTYASLISNFSPKEVAIMLDLPKSKTIVGHRIRENQQCQNKFAELLRERVDIATVPTKSQSDYKKWIGA